jgi:FAD/FMN-containing dehydrogenase
MAKALTLDTLRGGFRGQLLTSEDAGYDDARKAFNAMFNDRRPAVIARCSSIDDVVAALRFGRESGLAIALRGGGHSVAGYSTVDGGLLIDLGLMKDIGVDAGARRVRAQAGVTWGEFDAATQAEGLAVTGGRVTTTGIAGLTLGSGSGWLERRFGFVIDNLLSVDLVTAEGRLVTASKTENEELFFGLCGGGGNFGIATSLEYQLHPLGPIVMGGLLLHRREGAGEIVKEWRDVMMAAPDELCSGVVFLTAPPLPFVPEDLHFQPAVGFFVLFAGAVEESEDAVASLRRIGPAEVDAVMPMPYTAVQTLIDAGNPPGRQQYWKSENVQELTDQAIDVLVEHANEMTSPFSFVVIEPKRGAISRADEDETALGHRDVFCTFYGIAQWEDPAENDTHIAWARGLAEAMTPHITAGVALNFNPDEGEDRVRSTFGPKKYERLVALKREWDPENVFRINQNIKP